MKSRTLLRDRGHNVPIEAYNGNRAAYRLKQSLDALSLRNHQLAGALADESRGWRELSEKLERNQP